MNSGYNTSESSLEQTFGGFNWLFEESSTIREEKEESPSFSSPVNIKDYYEPVWTTKNGDKIALSKMETRHILNCIRLLESKHMYHHKCGDSEKHKHFLESWYRIFQNELERRKTGQLETSYSL